MERASAEQTRLFRQPRASRPALPLGLFPSSSANRYCYSFQAPRQPIWLRGLKLSPIPLGENEITLCLLPIAPAGLPLCIAPLHIALPSRGASWGSGSHSPL